ncbi:hypothetical protein AB205_0112600 [Aquarana catesbeiana]|uniref:Uncharacterized protein n=1 Tax=Aquarana catesbeiana TaxID=8400 RepID=A0A2G9RFV9_AQUCT|nr:hypothetical protein AB205_0112600 [Aquarana catesbeiana]
MNRYWIGILVGTPLVPYLTGITNPLSDCNEARKGDGSEAGQKTELFISVETYFPPSLCANQGWI